MIPVHSLIDEGGHLRGLRLSDERIVGPAVLTPMPGTSFDRCSWDVGDLGLDAMLWVIEPGRQGVVGAVGVLDCAFVRCEFVNIGIAGYGAFIDAFRRDLGELS